MKFYCGMTIAKDAGNDIASHINALRGYQQRMNNLIHDRDVAAPECFVSTCFNDWSSEIIFLKDLIKKQNPTLVLVIGIGGSSLGAQAILSSLGPRNGAPRSIFVDTIDVTQTAEYLKITEHEIATGGSVFCIVISKSGKTTETLINAACSYELIKKYYPDTFRERIVVITDKGSVLWHGAQKEGFICFEIPAQLGGRFSVFSAVGIIPLIMMGIDVEALQRGARDATLRTLNNFDTAPAVMSAALLYAGYQRGYVIHDTFVFSPLLAGLANWYRQLLGESIGKERNGVKIGITPTMSVSTNDLHSVAQLYFAGPRNRFTTLVYYQDTKEGDPIPSNFFSLLETVGAGNTIGAVQSAVTKAVTTAYEEAQLPFVRFELERHSVYDLGMFMQTKMLEIMFLAHLFDINAFDQPQVELYKRELRKLLE